MPPGIDPASANSYSDHNIKQEYSAAQLLEDYRQGLELEPFERRATDTDVEYSFDYIYPVKSSPVYYSDLHVDIDLVSSENL